MRILHRSGIPSTVITLGIVSLLTDLSSEMIFPLLPMFVTTVLGGSALSLGLIEGAAESIAAILKALSGSWADRIQRRKPFMLAGYGLAGIARPLIGLAGSWVAVFALRFMDRVGKGIRTAPRDAMIADITPSDKRGSAFGFHRAMDHLGAAAGPLVAAILLKYMGLSLRQVFLLAAVPAAIVVLLIVYRVSEVPAPSTDSSAEPTLSWALLSRKYKFFLFSVFVFSFANASDAFLILLLSTFGVSPAGVALLWGVHHLIKTVSTYIGGRIADALKVSTLIVAGWFLYGVFYSAFAFADSRNLVVTLFLLYGFYFGLTEPAEKALVSRLTTRSVRGRAFGYYHAVLGLAALPANLLFGWLWKNVGIETTFLITAVPAFIASILLAITSRIPETE